MLLVIALILSATLVAQGVDLGVQLDEKSQIELAIEDLERKRDETPRAANYSRRTRPATPKSVPVSPSSDKTRAALPTTKDGQRKRVATDQMARSAPVTSSSSAASKSKINIDDKRPDEQFTTTLFGRPLTIGGEYEIRPEYTDNFSLGEDRDRESFLDQFLIVELFYEISDYVSFFVDAAVIHSREIFLQEGKLRSDTSVERGQTWLLFENLFDTDFDLQLGSQYFSDPREWWWDDILDGANLYYYGDDFSAELGIGETIVPVSSADDGLDADEEDVTWILGQTIWKWADSHTLSLFLASQLDHSGSNNTDSIVDDEEVDEVDADLYWAGLRASGRWKHKKAGRFYYWVDTGYVGGEEKITEFSDGDSGQSIAGETVNRDVSGWALDLGTTWRTTLPWKPAFTLGFAMGSGDSNPEGDDKSFRQTGLQDNNGRFRGVNRFRYYGELLDPELSNLKIFTASVGMPLLNNSSVELIYHYYDQVETASFLRDSRLFTDPTGDDTEIGQEIDLVLGIEEWKHLELEFVASVFEAGEAFGDASGDIATNFVFKLDYNF